MHGNEKPEQEVAALGDLPHEDLVARWAKAHRCLPPKGLKRGLLERAAAWHLQAKSHGGLSPEAKKRLKAATRQLEYAPKRPHLLEQGSMAPASTPIKGTALPEHQRFISDQPAEATVSGRAALAPAPRPLPQPGTRLLREWNGRQHFVDVVDGGFVLDGKTYRSLSAIARQITGARWSGPRFFGL